MQYTLDRFAAEIREALIATNLLPADAIELAEPKANVPADLALPCFKAAKQTGMAPPQLAQQLANAIQFGPDSLVGGVQAAGPFLNFTLNQGQVTQQVLAEVAERGERYGSDDLGSGQKVVVEYSSPNIARRMHIGHIRSTIIGQSINNILSFLGYETIADNHLGDYGKQFGTLLAAMDRFGRPQGEGEGVLAEIEELYARYNRLIGAADADPDDPDAAVADDVARSWSLRLEQGDAQARELWQWMVEATIRANQRNYDRLGVHFDTQHGESFYADMLPDVLAKVRELDVAEHDPGGAIVIKGLRDRNGKELPTFLVQRSDGGTLYLTRDLATVIYRETEYHPSKLIYIVGQPQELHFRQVFALVRAMGYAQNMELVHISFGTVFDADGQPFSMRRGKVLHLQTLLDEAKARAKAKVEEKIAEGKTELSPKQIDEVAEIVGVGAVIYNDLYQDSKRNITLDWERMLSFEGNSAPYIQYTHARCRSILREAGDRAATDVSVLEAEQELAVIKQLARFPDVVRRAGEQYAPYMIAEWLYSTAREFARFYRDLSVLKAATPELRAARLQLVEATATGLQNGLALLGIRAPERM
jgi:arginyl-tRNA synthetase